MYVVEREQFLLTISLLSIQLKKSIHQYVWYVPSVEGVMW